MTWSLHSNSSESLIFVEIVVNNVSTYYHKPEKELSIEIEVNYSFLQAITIFEYKMSKFKFNENQDTEIVNGDANKTVSRNSLNAESPIDSHSQQNGLTNGHSKSEQNGTSFPGDQQQGRFAGFDLSDDVSNGIVNNAITNAPSRHTFMEPNVFQGGRTVPKRHKKHRRSKTPDFSKQNGKRNGEVADGPQFDSILSRLDYSIRTQFGDWNDEDEKDFGPSPLFKSNGIHNHPPNGHRQVHKDPYAPSRISPVIPPPGNYMNGHMNGTNGSGMDDFLSLPRLFKPYDNVVKSNKLMVNDPIYKLSKDNSDPNSILSQAKRTLTQVGADNTGSSVTAMLH